MVPLAVIGAIHNAHVYPLSCLPQAGFAQGNKQPNTTNNSTHCCTTTKHIEPCQQNKSAMEPFVQRSGHFFNWMQSLMKKENAGLMIQNNASTDWAPTSWWWRPSPGLLVNHSQLPCGSWRCNKKHHTYDINYLPFLKLCVITLHNSGTSDRWRSEFTTTVCFSFQQ